MTAKYIVVLNRGVQTPILWPTFAAAHMEIEAVFRPLGGRVVSAGFCLPADGWRCFGESVTLGIASRGEIDTALMREHFVPVLAPDRAAVPPAPAVLEEQG